MHEPSDVRGRFLLASAGGASGTSGLGGTSGAANTTGGSEGNSVVGAGASGPVLTSLYCGDGIRDAAAGSKEECDDGLGTNPDLCTDRCQVNDALAVRGAAGGAARYLGAGRHPVSAGPYGFGVSFVEPAVRPAVVGLSVFDATGDPRSRIAVSTGANPVLLANPAVAALDDGSYAVVWTDFDGDGDELGVALRRVRPVPGTGALPPESAAVGEATLSPLQFANDTRSFSQSDADIVRAGERLIVAWTDTSDALSAPDVRYREFDISGAPTRRFAAATDELPLSFEKGFEGNVALAAIGESWVAAYRSMQGGVEETIEVVIPDEGSAWSIGPDLMGSPEDRPAIAALDPEHLLVVFTVGTDPGETSVSDVYRLAAAVIDRAENEPVDVFELPPLDAAYQNPTVSQTHPNLVRAGNDLYVAYRASSLVGQAEAENIFVQRLSWDGELTVENEYRIPRWAAGSLGDQRFPALAAGPRQMGTPGLPEPAPFGALVMAWDDYGRQHGASQGRPDVLVQHWPLPIVRLDSRRPSDCSVAEPCGEGEGPCESDAECEEGLVCSPDRGLDFGLPADIDVCVSGPWDPENVPLTAWYDASQGVTVSSGKVSVWADQSGNGRDVAMPNAFFQPTYASSGWNGGEPTITFTPPSILYRDSWPFHPMGMEAPYTILAVVDVQAAQESGILSWWGDGGTVGAAWLTPSGSSLFMKNFRLDTDWNEQEFTGSVNVATSRHVLAYRYGGDGVFKFNVDNSATETSANQGTINWMVGTPGHMIFVIGAQNGLGDPYANRFTGNMSELIVVPDAISDADLADFRDYAQAKWGGLAGNGEACTQPSDCVTNFCVAGICEDAWTPDDVSPSMWFHAGASHVTVVSGGVSQWSDRSGNGNHVTMSSVPNRPAYAATGWNGNRPTLAFDGAWSVLTREPWPTQHPIGLEHPYTIFAVIKPLTIQHGSLASWWGTGGLVAAWTYADNGSLFLQSRRASPLGGDHQFTGSTNLSTTRHVVAYRYDGAGVFRLTVDGTTQTSSNLGTVGNMQGGPDLQNQFIVGWQDLWGTARYAGDLSELVVVATNVSDTTVARFRAYAQAEWGGL